jgi:hypothetical protein
VENDIYGTQGRLINAWFEAHPCYDPYQDPTLWYVVNTTDAGQVLDVKGEYAWSVLSPYMWWRAGQPQGGQRIVEQSTQQTTTWIKSGGWLSGIGAIGPVFTGGAYRTPDGRFASNPNPPPAQPASATHANSLDYSGKNWVYTLVDRDRGKVMNFGETTATDPLSRYSATWYAKKNVNMVPMAIGSKQEIHELQHTLNVMYNTPWSKNGW